MADTTSVYLDNNGNDFFTGLAPEDSNWQSGVINLNTAFEQPTYSNYSNNDSSISSSMVPPSNNAFNSMYSNDNLQLGGSAFYLTNEFNSNPSNYLGTTLPGSNDVVFNTDNSFKSPSSTSLNSNYTDYNSSNFLSDAFKNMMSLTNNASQQKYNLLKNNIDWQHDQYNKNLQFQKDVFNQQQNFAQNQWNDQMGLYQKNMDFQREQFDWSKEIQQANLDFQREQFDYNKKITDWELGAKQWSLDVQKDEYNRKSALRDQLTASYGGN